LDTVCGFFWILPIAVVIYMYTYICVNTYIFNIYAQVHIFRDVWRYLILIFLNSLYSCSYIHVQYIHICVNTYVFNIYIYIYIYIYICIYMNRYTNTYILRCIKIPFFNSLESSLLLLSSSCISTSRVLRMCRIAVTASSTVNLDLYMCIYIYINIFICIYVCIYI
jgi:hypothetical protein